MAEKKLPIDIQSKQLVEALVDRRIVPHDWPKQYKQIRDAIASLYQDLPLATEALSDFRARKTNHEKINYFDCKLILQYLEQSDEGAAKNIFGQYTSPIIKRWSALIRQYEKNNIFAAETARILTQNTVFEIPFYKKFIQQNEKEVVDNNRKIVDLTKSIVEYKRKHQAYCANMGIEGVNIREELRRLPLELPSLFHGVATAICCEEICDAIEYHQALQVYLHDSEVSASATESDKSAIIVTKKDKKTRKKGKKQIELAGEPEIKAEEPYELIAASHNFFFTMEKLRNASDELVESAPTLDFEAEAADIIWDISIDDTGTADADEIDWGIRSVASVTASSTLDDVPAEIDWEITSSDVLEPIGEGGPFKTVEIMDSAENAFATTEKLTRVQLLANTEFRTCALNDLLEIHAFLCQRLSELSGSSSVAFANQFQGSSTLLEQQSTDKIEELLAATNRSISLLTSKRLRQLVLIKSSERYLDRHVANIEVLTKHMDKCRREISNLEDKNVSLIDANRSTQSQINALIAATKQLKKNLEGALPPLFKGHRVNIVGEVNTL
ncbi:putative CDK5 regulatory subunit-associated protein [Plasmopara halstedii]